MKPSVHRYCEQMNGTITPYARHSLCTRIWDCPDPREDTLASRQSLCPIAGLQFWRHIMLIVTNVCTYFTGQGLQQVCGLRRGIRQAVGCPWEPGTGCPHDLQPPFRHRLPLAWCGHPVLEGMEGVLALELVKLAVRPRSHSRVRK